MKDGGGGLTEGSDGLIRRGLTTGDCGDFWYIMINITID